jgi:hypothetical protein
VLEVILYLLKILIEFDKIPTALTAPREMQTIWSLSEQILKTFLFSSGFA